MSEFKFPCPKCSQRIQASGDWVGREIECPSCHNRIVIPAASKADGEAAPVSAATRAGESKAPESTPATAAAAGTPKAAPAQTVPSESGQTQTPAAQAAPAVKAPPAEGQVRVAVLTAQVKLEMVRSVRKRISEKSRWLPGTSGEGELLYAAKADDGKEVMVDPAAKEVERFSLIGAFLRELADRNVAQNAEGRRRLLDVEVPEAIKEVLSENQEDSAAPETPKELYSISHEQCLRVLDVLEERYVTGKAEAAAASASEKLGKTRVTDLVTKVEKKLGIPPEEIVTALVHEVNELKHRIEKLEKGRDRAPKP